MAAIRRATATRRARGRRPSLILAAALMSGCGGGPPAPADPAAAREALDGALAAWKEGKDADSLRDRRPSIVVSDDRWSRGYRLDRYEIAETRPSPGADLRVRVTLWERDPAGKAVKETTGYAVGTGSPFTVVRDQEF